MAINPVSITRISHNLQTRSVLNSVRQTQRDLFTQQARIASGRNFVVPSEDPVAAARALDLQAALGRQNQFLSNVRQADNFLLAADSTLTEINELLVEASGIAISTVGNLISSDEREATAEVVARLREQMESVANRDFGGRFLFSGRDTATQPFVQSLGGLAYVGDTTSLSTRVDDTLISPVSLPGNLLFGALSTPISTNVDLTPLLSETTRLDALTGANGQPLEPGALVFNDTGGAGAVTIDVASADTVGDIVTLINDAATKAGASFVASVGATGIEVMPSGSGLTISDQSAGSIAAGLGLLTPQPATEMIVGQSLSPRLTRLTSVTAMAGGVGMDLESGLVITNGTRTETVDLSAAETIQDIINTINNAGVGVLAKVSDDGTTIDVFNQVTGTSLTIGENGGTTATDLGIRTLDTATPLSRLNFGLGVNISEGVDDLRITAKDGSFVTVNLDGAKTVGDVIDLINEAATDATVSVSAEFAETGNGIKILDGTGGAGDLRVSIENLSTAAIDLGLDMSVSGMATELLGRDVNPTRADGIIGALLDLENGLRRNDTRAIGLAGQRLDSLRTQTTRFHGIVGARSQAMSRKLTQTEQAASTTEVFLSEVQDLDFTAAVTQLQASTAQLQATLQTSGTLLGISLLDFLR